MLKCMSMRNARNYLELNLLFHYKPFMHKAFICRSNYFTDAFAPCIFPLCTIYIVEYILTVGITKHIEKCFCFSSSAGRVNDSI